MSKIRLYINPTSDDQTSQAFHSEGAASKKWLANMTQANILSHAVHDSFAPDLSNTRERAWFLINRAYQNIYGMAIPSDPIYQQTIFNAAYPVMTDRRARTMNEKLLLRTFEDIIRISDEHHRESQKHLAKASNSLYLRETALDKAVEHQKYLAALEELMPTSQVSGNNQLSGRIHRPGGILHAEVVQIACQQLANAMDNKAS